MDRCPDPEPPLRLIGTAPCVADDVILVERGCTTGNFDIRQNIIDSPVVRPILTVVKITESGRTYGQESRNRCAQRAGARDAAGPVSSARDYRIRRASGWRHRWSTRRATSVALISPPATR